MFKKDLERGKQGELSKKHTSSGTGMEQPMAPSENEWKGHVGNEGPATNMAHKIRAGLDPDSGDVDSHQAQAQQHERRMSARKRRAQNLDDRFSHFYNKVRQNVSVGPPERLKLWNTDFFNTRCLTLTLTL